MPLSYCHVLKEVNPSTVTHIEVDNDNKFKYFLMLLGSTIREFGFMIKVIDVDGAWSKTQHKRVPTFCSHIRWRVSFVPNCLRGDR